MFRLLLTHLRAAKLKLTARTSQSISARPNSGQGNSVLNSRPCPTPTQPHMSAFSFLFLFGFYGASLSFESEVCFYFCEGNAATSGETETPIADTAETGTSCDLGDTLP